MTGEPSTEALEARLEALSTRQDALLRALAGTDADGDVDLAWLRGEIETVAGEEAPLIQLLRDLHERVERLAEENDRLQERVTALEGAVDAVEAQVADTGQIDNVTALLQTAGRLREDGTDRVVLTVENIRLALDVSERRAYQVATDYPERFEFLSERSAQEAGVGATPASERAAGLLVDFDELPDGADAPGWSAVRALGRGD